jgi:proteasome maturation protein
MDNHSIPFLRESQETLKYGLSKLRNHNHLAHPVQHIQKNWIIDEEVRENFAMQRVFGTQMVMRLQMEKEILSQFKRLPGLHSSFVGLETMLGTGEDIDFEDFLNEPGTSEITASVHDMVEVRLGM